MKTITANSSTYMHKLTTNLSCGLLSLMLLAAPMAHGAEYYTWVDENGVTNYAERQPKGYVVERVEKEQNFGYPTRNRQLVEAPPPPQLDTGPTADEAAAEEIARAAAELEAARTNNCDIGKKNYAQLKVFARLRIEDEDGTSRYMTPEEKQEQTEAAQKLIAENCGPAG